MAVSPKRSQSGRPSVVQRVAGILDRTPERGGSGFPYLPAAPWLCALTSHQEPSPLVRRTLPGRPVRSSMVVGCLTGRGTQPIAWCTSVSEDYGEPFERFDPVSGLPLPCT